jgi:Uma2 family endonuclease
MPVSVLKNMSVDEFLVWAIDQPERYELINGEPVAMSPERAIHARIKANVWSSLRNAIDSAGLHCEAFPDGMTIRINENTAYEPDALVQCGDPLDDDAIEVTSPIIVVEVVSPSSTKSDTNAKLDGYFGIPSIQHFLVVLPQGNRILHYQRDKDGNPQAKLLHGGLIPLYPPGLEIQVSTFFSRQRSGT